MIKSKDDYRFVSESDMRHIVIEGKPFGARSQKLILTGEDIAYLREAVAERGGDAVSGVIQVQGRGTSANKCDDVFKMARSGSWIKPEKEPKEGDVVEVCTFSGLDVFEDSSVARDKVQEFYRWNSKVISDHDKELTDKKKEWSKRTSDAKKAAADAEISARKVGEKKIREIEDGIIIGKEEAEKTAEDEYAEIIRKYEAEEITAKERDILIQKAADKKTESIEKVEVEGKKNIEKQRIETEQQCRTAWDPYYSELYAVDKEQKDYEKEWEKTYGEEYEKKYLELCEAVNDACKNYYTTDDYIKEYSKGAYECNKKREKGKISRSTFDAIIDKRWANDVVSSTKMECAFADLERMVKKGAGDKSIWARTAHANTYTYDGSHGYPHRYYEGENNDIEYFWKDDGVGSDGKSHYGETTYSSKVFRIYVGSRSDVEGETIEEVLAEVSFRRSACGENRKYRYDEEGEISGYDVTWFREYKYKNKVFKFSYVGINAEGYLDRIDAAADARDEKIEEAYEEYEKANEGLLEKKDEEEIAAEDAYKDRVKELDKELEKATVTAREKFFKTVNGENAEVNGKIENDPDNANRYYNEWLSKYYAAMRKMSGEIIEVKNRNDQEKYKADVAKKEAIREASKKYTDENKKIVKIRKEAVGAANKEYTEKRNKVYEDLEEEKARVIATTEEKKDKENADWAEKVREIEGKIADAFNDVFGEAEGVWWEGHWWGNVYIVFLDWDEEHEPEDEKKRNFIKAADPLANKMTEGYKSHQDALDGIEQERFEGISALPASIKEDARMIFECTIEPIDDDSCKGKLHYGGVEAGIGGIWVKGKYKTLTGNDYSDLYKATDGDDEEK